MLQKAAKIAAILEISERSVRGAGLENPDRWSGGKLANQIQGLRIPDHWDASEKNIFFLILRYLKR